MHKQVCVVGAGRWGRNHIRTLDGLGCLGGVVESDAEAREALAGQYPSARFFANLEAAVESGFDGYTVATPAPTHYDIASFLIEKKQHVLVEKPITLRASEARDLDAKARAAGVNLMVGHVLLFHPAIVKIKELIEADKIGKLQYIYSNRLNLGTVRTEENVFWSFAPHDISIFQYLSDSYPTDIVSRGGAFLQPGIHDSTVTNLTYPKNLVGHIFVSWLHPFKEHRMVVIGSKGMLSFEDSSESKQLLFYPKGIDWVQGEPIKRDGDAEGIDYGSAMPLTEEIRYFIDHLDGSPIEKANGQNAIEVMEILEKATASLSGAAEESDATPATETEKTAPDYFVHESSYVDDNVQIGKGTKIWHFSHIQSRSTIGEKVAIGQNVNVACNVTIGNHVKIQNNVSVYEGVTLEDYVFCGPSMVFTNVLDPRCKYPQRGSAFYHKTLVKEGASLGANSTIVCGNTIGRHAFIAAGAVVTKDVPDFALMAGVPARRRGWMCECGQVLGEVEAETTCSRCGFHYKRSNSLLEQTGKTG